MRGHSDDLLTEPLVGWTALDLFVGNDDGVSEIWINNGVGGATSFAAASVGASVGPTAEVSDTRGAVFGDVNGDGKIDLFEVIDGVSKIWVGDGTGSFSTTSQTFDSVWAYAFGDANGDGAIDLLLSVTEGRQLWLNNNDNTGTFTQMTGNGVPYNGGGWARTLSFGDIDGNGGARTRHLAHARTHTLASEVSY